MTRFRIGSRDISESDPPFVIMEAGINHEGEIDKAIALVDAAAEGGADCIKFQCHITEEEMIPTDMKPGEISDESLWDIIKRCELTAEEERRVQQYCAERDILYVSTPFSRAAADRLESMDVPAFKIGSGECNNYPLIEHIAGFGKPVILSTGMNDIASIRPSVQILQAAGCPLALMHCTSMYPTPYDKVRLGAVAQLRTEFDVPVGLSDHSFGIYTCLGAVALGASLVEKHFTVSKAWPGPDIPVSVDPAELRQLVDGARAIWQARGGAKTILAEEQPVIDFAYATVVTIAPLAAGEELTRENIWVKRPGTGPIRAVEFDSLLGRRVARDVPTDVHLRYEDIAAD